MGKHYAEEIPEDIHDWDAFFLPGITYEKQTVDVEKLFINFVAKSETLYPLSVSCGILHKA